MNANGSRVTAANILAGKRTPPGGVIYNEVPNGETMIDRCALWDLVYEHYSYFTPVSLELAGARAGLAVDAMPTRRAADRSGGPVA